MYGSVIQVMAVWVL